MTQDTKNISPKQAILDGFHFVRHIDVDMLQMLGGFFILSLVITYPQIYFFSASSFGIEVSLTKMPLILYVIQKILFDQHPHPYFRYFIEKPMWRLVWAAILCVFLLLVPTALISAICALFLWGLGHVMTVNTVTTIGLIAIAVVAICYFIIRFSFLYPHTIMKNNIELKNVFNLSKGIV